MASRPARVVAAVVAAAGLVACTATLPTAAPGTCSVVVRDPDAASRALAAAGAGTVVCLEGDGFRDADLTADSSGVAGMPVVLRGPGVTVRSVTVIADHLTVEGLTVHGGAGIVLEGAGLVVRDTTVRDAELDGISCELACRDVVIERNTVTGTDGTGIIVEGERIAVRDNAVSGSVRREAGDADGIRFFGSDIRITGNTVTDIKDDGYADPPHTDCFQTYDNSRPPTVGAVVSGNVCRNVDHQCLIATAEESGRDGEVGRSRDIEFSGNVCDVEGSQAVLVRWVHQVTVRGNTFGGPGLDRAAIFLDGSTGAGFYGNTVPVGVVAYEVDESSGPGFGTDLPPE